MANPLTYCTENFTIKEFLRTSTGFYNIPEDDIIFENLKHIMSELQYCRSRIGVPIRVNSGYRSTAVNAAVGGSPTSMHLLGLAADVRCSRPLDTLKLLVTMLTSTDYHQIGIYYCPDGSINRIHFSSYADSNLNTEKSVYYHLA
ncbi:peptidase [Sigmofec virus UA08Rod_4043]|uniref:Peptidase n=1 Tax=Sigmofec virus UA08Rod_4043 TaxID=2929393 RepID=A0A976N1H7_9VIRU|nr:peptidase [Sigmofec virus UA08Rod_4043]